MTKLLLITLLLTTVACDNGARILDCLDSCSIENGKDGKDGKSIVGPKGDQGESIIGPQGLVGASGSDGLSCSVADAPGGALITCGSSSQFIADGSQGDTGDSGSDGIDGESCTIAPVSNGAVISCGGNTSAVILNGVNGNDGQDAPVSAYTVTEVIDPCGPQGAYDEVLLKMANGQILAHYSHGNKQFLTVIGAGSYVSTDGNSCFFTVHSDGSVTW